jgi:protein MpaA
VRWASHALLLGLAFAVGSAEGAGQSQRVENRVLGYTILLPAGWHAAVIPDDGSLTIATYRPPSVYRIAVTPPRGQTWIRLYDEGALWSLPSWARRRSRPLAGKLPALDSYEGFGPARRLEFARDRHLFLAFVKGQPRKEVLRILASVRVTAYGRSLANVHTVRIAGRSVEGRPIRAWRVGNPRSSRRLLVVGCIHGTECVGMAITQQLVNLGRPIPIDLWVVQDLNPDGLAAGTRQNAHGVDLNRNFGAMWKPIGRPGSFQYSGPRPWSERETRIARALVLRLHPDVTIWFHQPQALVRAWGRSVPLARRYARLAHLPFRAFPWPNGTATNWQNHLGEVSFVVELPPGRLSLSASLRYARAVLSLLG